MDVDVRGFHDPQRRLVCLRLRGERMQRDEGGRGGHAAEQRTAGDLMEGGGRHGQRAPLDRSGGRGLYPFAWRSEEHTSELQSLMRISYAVFCLKKKKQCQAI